MDGMLSQDEINALLNGVDLSADDKGSAAATTATVDSSEEGLTDVEKDAIGEVANISMGTSATTLYSLVNRKVNITTPVVEMTTWEEVLTNYEKPCVFIQIKYTVGLNGTNILVLKEHDVKVITDLMMGGRCDQRDGLCGGEFSGQGTGYGLYRRWYAYHAGTGAAGPSDHGIKVQV